MTAIIRQTPDRKAATRKIIAVDSEGWNIPLTKGVVSSNPYVADKGWHSDVMLCAADDQGNRKSIVHDGSRREATDTQARNYGLPTEDCLEFLLDLPHDATVVGFYFSYDTTKLIGADLPLENIRELSEEDGLTQKEYNDRCMRVASENNLTAGFVHASGIVGPASTVWNGYWLKYTPRKELIITDLDAGRIEVIDRYYSPKLGKTVTAPKPKSEWARRVTVWDVFGFFQSAFLKALTTYRCGECPTCKNKLPAICDAAPWTQADLDYIDRMKLTRGVFDASQQTEILEYCFKECEFLSFLVRDLMKVIDALGLKMARWDGSGAVASAWMKKYGIKDYLPRRETVWIPGDAITLNELADGKARFNLSGLPEWVALQGYFGGRFEVSEIGYMGRLYGNDINSAYPYIAANLPCLAHGRFERVTEYVPDSLGIYLVGSKTADYRCGKCEPCKSLTGSCVKTKFAPFPFRTDNTINREYGVVKDAIYYCHGGQRWVWQAEVAAARKHFGAEAIPVHDGYIWIPECNHKPFTDIPAMYLKRQRYQAEGNGIEKAIKLVLNSLYGKTAQSIGWNIDKYGDKNPPPFQCYIWAGMITSGCRAMILDAIMQPGADCVSIATDGILTRGKLDLRHTRPEKALGDWEDAVVTNAYLFQSGVYTMNEPCKNFECNKPHKHEPISWNDREDWPAARVYKTRGFSAREVPYTELIAAWDAKRLTVHADPSSSRFVPMKSGKDRTDALEYIGQWIPSEHDVSFTHNRRIPVYPTNNFGIPDLSTIAGVSLPHTIPDDMISAPYSPKQTWDDVMEHQPPHNDADYQEV